MKRLLRSGVWKYVVAFLAPMIFLMLINHALDNDSWFVLAEGRYILNNGVYYTDVLSMHSGIEVTVQQYGFAVIFWLAYSVLGPAGLYIMMIILNLLICYLLYKICLLLSNENKNLSLLIMMLADCLLIMGFVTTRAQMVSYVILLAVIYVLELYIKTDKTKLLWCLPLLSLIQINLHASVWWFIVLVMITYIVDSFRKTKWHLQGYRTKPLALMLPIVFLAGLINPYGIKMISFIFTNYGASAIVGLVSEMKPFDLKSIFGIFLYIALSGVLVFYIWGNGKRMRTRYLLMIFGFLALGLNSIKGMSQLILVMFLPLALVYRNARIENVLNPGIGRRAVVFWSGVVSAMMAVVLIAVVPWNISNSPSDALSRAVDAIDDSVQASGEDKEKMNVYAGYDFGGWLEFRGYKPFIDSRAEVFIGKETDEEDSILDEYNNILYGDIDVDAFLKKYFFHYLLTNTHEKKMYELNDKRYSLIYEDSDVGIRVWRYVGA